MNVKILYKYDRYKYILMFCKSMTLCDYLCTILIKMSTFLLIAYGSILNMFSIILYYDHEMQNFKIPETQFNRCEKYKA
jgi:hypothetical protein